MGSADTENKNEVDFVAEYGKTLKILPSNDQIKELQTIIRDRLVKHMF